MSKKDPAIELLQAQAKLEILEEVLVDIGETLSEVSPDPEKATLSGDKLHHISIKVQAALAQFGYIQVGKKVEGAN